MIHTQMLWISTLICLTNSLSGIYREVTGSIKGELLRLRIDKIESRITFSLFLVKKDHQLCELTGIAAIEYCISKPFRRFCIIIPNPCQSATRTVREFYHFQSNIISSYKSQMTSICMKYKGKVLTNAE